MRSHLLLLVLCICCACTEARGQQEQRTVPDGLFFPAPMGTQRWRVSVGVLTFTTPEDLTEEVRVRVPAIDAHVLRHVHGGFQLDARLLVQVVQNHASLGLRWNTPLGKRFHFGVGDDVGYWRGDLPIDGFDSKASGWDNTPNLSFGYRSTKGLLITAKAEVLLTTNYTYTIEERTRPYDTDHVSGHAYSLYLEQPFYKRTRVTLGFTAAFTDMLWATWSLFEHSDRRLFYPEITMGLIL